MLKFVKIRHSSPLHAIFRTSLNTTLKDLSVKSWKKLSLNLPYFVLRNQVHFSLNQEDKYSWFQMSLCMCVSISISIQLQLYLQLYLSIQREQFSIHYIFYIYIYYRIYILYTTHTTCIFIQRNFYFQALYLLLNIFL